MERELLYSKPWMVYFGQNKANNFRNRYFNPHSHRTFKNYVLHRKCLFSKSLFQQIFMSNLKSVVQSWRHIGNGKCFSVLIQERTIEFPQRLVFLWSNMVEMSKTWATFLDNWIFDQIYFAQKFTISLQVGTIMPISTIILAVCMTSS